jgi:general nucleoside transport system ATP-binding protein
VSSTVALGSPGSARDRSSAHLQVAGVRHRFGATQALDGVDLDVRPGEIHALVGENGAGKSTLVNVVAGLIVPDEGTVSVDGSALGLGRRAASVEAGIGIVHQHFSLIETLTAAENYLLGRPGTPMRLPLADAAEQLHVLGQDLDLPVEPTALVADLTIGQRQRLEILTALGWGARLLLLDEPSAVLAPEEADSLLDAVVGLGEAGLGVLLITHKLREVERYADRVTVLRSGRVVGEHGRADISRDVLVAEMVGEHQAVLDRPTPRAPGQVRLSLTGIVAGRLRGVDLDLHAGQVCGLAGVAGSGQTEIVEVISGLTHPESGTVSVDGTDITGDAVRSWAAGVAVIPEDRARDALAMELPVWVNAVAKRLPEIGGRFGVDRSRVGAMTDAVLDRMGVQPRRGDIITHALSGGNQQRLVLGRELDRHPNVVIAAEPSRGLDPPSASAVVRALRDAAAQGAAVLVLSSDVDELFLVSDRMVALCHGELTLDAPADECDLHRVGHAMASHDSEADALAHDPPLPEMPVSDR